MDILNNFRSFLHLSHYQFWKKKQQRIFSSETTFIKGVLFINLKEKV